MYVNSRMVPNRAAQQLIQPDASIASLSSLSAPIMLYAACSARVNSGVRHALEKREKVKACVAGVEVAWAG